jgi:hypothetical protein
MRASVVVGAAAAQPAIDAWLATAPPGRRAIVVECAFSVLSVPADVPLTRLGAGCVCCLGQVPLRVGLTRMVRSVRPDAVLLVLGHGEHLERVRALLADGSLGVRFDID